MKSAFILRFMSLLTLCLTAAGLPAYALTQSETDELVRVIDERQRNSGDYAATVLIYQEEKKDGTKKAFKARSYRRDADDKWMIIFTEPRAEAGKGYLRIEKNLFLYESKLGKWERQTERASIMGTNSRREDFDESRLSEEYDSQFLKDETLGKFKVYHLKLTAKKNADVANPIIELWVDQGEKNILKRQEFALSGKLLRSTYYDTWEKKMSKSKNGEVYVPQKIYAFDEVEKGNNTTIILSDVNLDPLQANIFTKAWVESQSR